VIPSRVVDGVIDGCVDALADALAETLVDAVGTNWVVVGDGLDVALEPE
jgi:hypothetical protein